MGNFQMILGGCAVALLAACQSGGEPAAPLPAAEVAAAKQQWGGKWVGSWGDGCMGSIEVSEVTGTSAKVLYSWWNCGERPPGSQMDPGSPISGDTLTVDAGWARVTYVMTGPNTLQANYTSRRGDARATFLRQLD